MVQIENRSLKHTLQALHMLSLTLCNAFPIFFFHFAYYPFWHAISKHMESLGQMGWKQSNRSESCRELWTFEQTVECIDLLGKHMDYTKNRRTNFPSGNSAFKCSYSYTSSASKTQYVAGFHNQLWQECTYLYMHNTSTATQLNSSHVRHNITETQKDQNETTHLK